MYLEIFKAKGYLIMPSVTRIAPSPTGQAHIGTFRTAYINYLQARSTGGKFILRIDDTDTERNKPEWTQLILDSLDWLGLEYDEIHYQSKRTDLYQRTARKLVEEGKAFSPTGVAAILLKPPVALPNSFLDTIAGEIPITDTNRKQIEGGVIGDKTSNGTVLLRENGTATYQFASIVDDYELGINHIVRGVDHITNTPKQIAIWNTLDLVDVHNYRPFLGNFPKFTHLGLIFKDKKKLSKRDGASSLMEYKEQGYKPEAILNWLLLMGWGLSVPRGTSKEESKALQKAASEPISKQVAIELFQKGTLKNSPCSYDINKLIWLQKRYK